MSITITDFLKSNYATKVNISIPPALLDIVAVQGASYFIQSVL